MVRMKDYGNQEYQFLEKALSHPLKLVRKQSLQQIQDLRLLQKFVMKSDDLDLKTIAFYKINDEEIIKELAFASLDPNLRLYSILNLKEQTDDLFEHFVREDPSFMVKREALEKIKNQKTLIKLITELQDPALKKIALSKIADDYTLKRIAVRDPNPKIRFYAIRLLQKPDPLYLFQRALKDHDFFVRELACRLLRDQKLLARLATESSDRLLAEQAIMKLVDLDELALLRMVAPSNLQHTIAKRIKQLKE